MVPQTQESTLLTRFISLAQESPRVALLMSGGGSNAKNILLQRARYPNLNFIAVATDAPGSNASVLAKEFNLVPIVLDWAMFKTRDDFFTELHAQLKSLDIDLLVYAGFMRVSPGFFVSSIPGMNVHPSDLSIRDEAGNARFTGMAALGDMVASGSTYVASTAHIVDEKVDQGSALIVSRHFLLKNTDTTDIKKLHEALKQYEHELYPRALELLAAGKVSEASLPLAWEDAEKI